MAHLSNLEGVEMEGKRYDNTIQNKLGRLR